MPGPTPDPSRAWEPRVCNVCKCLKPHTDFPLPIPRASCPGGLRVSRHCLQCRAESMAATREHERCRLAALEPQCP